MIKNSRSLFGNRNYWRRVGAIVCVVALCSSVRAADVIRYKAQPLGSTVKIEGTSNIHDWELDGNIVGGFFEIPASLILDSTKGDIAGAGDGEITASAEVSIPITSLKNGHWEGMDEVMQQALNAANYPRIQYRLTSMTLKTPHAASSPIQFDTTGELSINGITNKISMTVGIETVDANKLKITSSAVPIKMTDYKVPPPVKLGLFKTEPDVKISFVWAVSHKAKSGESK